MSCGIEFWGAPFTAITVGVGLALGTVSAAFYWLLTVDRPKDLEQDDIDGMRWQT